jgi:hypothetical protein
MSIAALSSHRSKHIGKTEFVRIKRARAGVNSKSPQSAMQRIEDGLSGAHGVSRDSSLAG